ncbi:site-specific integrase [Microbacterium sp. zg-YB36]|uniref:tyrosine-type recombinase/integrase n=1 Tax=Microbacterium sp. zg-YB36 TaxID=2969407 RepID=UPI00214B32DE|nr:site-specific integrase [Microbacterium sp. zg-YB36]MDL5351091.1 tyrosine-type recombinase/integrase [Microbacterium sp. zg-YB36]
MAWTQQLPSGNWRGLYRGPDGKPRNAGTFAHQKRALAEATNAEHEADKPGWRDPRAGARKWGEWYEEWRAVREDADKLSQTDKSLLKNHIIPAWQDVALASITRFDVRAWAAKLGASKEDGGAGLSESTVKRVVAVFSGSLSAAIDKEILATNPCFRLGLEPGETDVVRFFSRKRVAKMLKKLKDRPEDRAMLAIMVGCGLRWGEMAGLRPERVDLKRRMLRVSHVRKQNGKVKKYPKGRKIRDVPIPEWVVAEIKPFVKEGREFVFMRTNSSNWRRDVWSHLDTGGRIHDLRHTYASWLLQSGVEIAKVSKLMGHSSIRVTERYAHLALMPMEEVDAAMYDPRRVA